MKMYPQHMEVYMISMDGSYFSVIISPSKKTNWCQVPNKEEKEANSCMPNLIVEPKP